MDLLQELRSSGEAAIDKWIADGLTENLHFDCKLKADPSKPQLTKEDRRNLGKACSAFANSDGGLILWGVDSRAVADQDCLRGKQPISNLEAFKNNVEQAISDLISPPIQGLSVYIIRSSVDPSAGFLAVEIPASEYRPHMSRNNDTPGFYFRNGHQSLLMEVFQVRDQMLRRTVAKLSVKWRPRYNPNEPRLAIERNGKVTLCIDLSLNNDSTVSARFPYLRIKPDTTYYLGMGPRYHSIAQFGLPTAILGEMRESSLHQQGRFPPGTRHYSGGADTCVHPGMEIPVAAISISVPINRFNYRSGQVFVELDYTGVQEVYADIIYGCQDSSCEVLRMALTAADIQALLLEHSLAGHLQIG